MALSARARSSAGSETRVPVTFEAIGTERGERGLEIAADSGSTAASINGEWNAPATLRRTTLSLRSAARAPRDCDRCDLPDHHLLRRVPRCDEQDVAASLVAQRRRVRAPDAEEGRHRSGTRLARRLASPARGPPRSEGVGELEHAGRHERGELAERVTRGADEPDAERLEHRAPRRRTQGSPAARTRWSRARPRLDSPATTSRPIASVASSSTARAASWVVHTSPSR